MGIKILVGSHGTGKSDWIYNHFLNLSKKDGKIDFSKVLYLVVPEQDTLEKQKIMMEKSNAYGILNIDVVSFDRIAYNVFGKLNIKIDEENIIDDTAKVMLLESIVLRLLKEDKLRYYKKNAKKVGFAEKLMQVVSEFYSYNITSENIESIINKNDSDIIKDKLSDLDLIYQSFVEALNTHSLTIKEDKYNLLEKNISRVSIFDNAYIAFDGFTGFTPIQMKILEHLLKKSKEIYITVDMRLNKDLDATKLKELLLDKKNIKQEDIFYLSEKFIYDILKNFGDQVELLLRYDDYKDKNFINKYNNDKNTRPDLELIENYIFDYNRKKDFDVLPQNIELYSANSIEDEIMNAIHIIHNLTKGENAKYKYNDIRIVVPTIDDYRFDFIKLFRRYNIPLYIDDNTNVINSPYIESIRAAIDVVMHNFSYDSCLRFLSTGIFEKDNFICELDNVVRRYGIRGYKRYESGFENLSEFVNENGETIKKQILTEEFINKKNEIFKPLLNLYYALHKKKINSDNNIEYYLKTLFDFIREIKLNDKFDNFLVQFEEKCKNDYDFIKQQKILLESVNVVKKTFKNLKSIASDFSNISLSNFSKLLDIGFTNSPIKTIPFGIDQVMVGDIMRSRFDNPKVLIFMGMSQSKVPSATNDTSIINDKMRLAFEKEDINLSQTTIETALNQRFYLYLILTNPLEKLIMSFSKRLSDGVVDNESSIITDIKNIFGKKASYENDSKYEVYNLQQKKININDFHFFIDDDIYEYIARNIQNIKEYLADSSNEDNNKYTNAKIAISFIKYLLDANKNDTNAISFINKYFTINNGKGKIRNITPTLIKNLLENRRVFTNGENEKDINYSIVPYKPNASNIETYNKCHYQFFLDRVLHLKERDKYEITAIDLGNYYHSFMQEFFNNNFNLKNKSDADIDKRVGETIEKILPNADKFANVKLWDSDFYGYQKLNFINSIALNSLITTIKMLKKIYNNSSFDLFELEKKFDFKIDGIDENDFDIVTGKIDKIEKFETNDSIFVNIIDYKSSKKELKVNDVKNGISIQLVLYIDEVMSHEKVKNKKNVFCGAFYFHIHNPIVSINNLFELKNIDKSKLVDFSYNGISNNDIDAIKMINGDLAASYNKNKKINKFETSSGFSILGQFLDEDGLNEMRTEVRDVIKESMKCIKEGNINISPYKSDVCNYCKYKNICCIDEMEMWDDGESNSDRDDDS